MIDFRYHLISIVAVLLALSIGIITGSGFLGGPLLEQLEGRVDDLEKKNEELLGEVRASGQDAAFQEQVVAALEPDVLRGTLAGRSVVLWRIDGTGDEVADAIATAVEESGGRVAATLTLTTDLRLEDLDRREELTTMLGVPDVTAPDLRIDLGTILGSRAAAAAEGAAGPGPEAELQELVDELEGAGYLTVESEDPADIVPVGADFVVGIGGTQAASFEPEGLVVALASSLARRENPVVVAEQGGSVWNVLDSVRADEATADAVTTVDSVDSAAGRISVALGLVEAETRPGGDYGSLPEAEEPIPPLSPPE